MELAFGALVALTLIYTFLNGFNGSATLVGTLISSGVLSARNAFVLAGLAEFAGSLAFGTAVARTIGGGIVEPGVLSVRLLIAAMFGALSCGLLASRLGFPVSSTHALVGGLLGPALLLGGPAAAVGPGLGEVVLSLALGPALGLVGGWLLMKLVRFVAAGFSPRINVAFKHLQIVTALALALSHGSNEAQKSMGIIALGLVAAGLLPGFEVPGWARLSCALVIAAGVTVGGERVLRTLSARIYRIRPIHGFTAQGCSAAVVLLASLLGGPVSTNQVATSAIFGVGAAERPSKVRWELGRNILLAWLVTIPVAALLAAIAFLLLPFVRS